uniref:Interleukin 10 receptor subunit beta n=1 Tax=Scleropages formosus TaxID=113540 RepID=A0A8C9WUV1_SCLFO
MFPQRSNSGSLAWTFSCHLFGQISRFSTTTLPAVLYTQCFIYTLGWTVVLAVIPDPANVTVVSYNLGVVLEWDYPHEWHENVTFTASSRTGRSYRVVFFPTYLCDFTKDVHHFGTYVFKVRAELQGEASRWVNTSDFSADKHTIIGPPGITLYSKDGDMEVELQDPVMRASTLREVYSMVTYNITFWKEGQEEKIKKNTEQTRLMLPNLQPWTNYCVQAQVYINAYTRNGELSKVVCKATTSNGEHQSPVAEFLISSPGSVCGDF